ncbi:MAG TPA: aspartate 1-decarboxylase, partial [Saprospiraceae bacterium]|nr:aspartate 1-decarboxylase [Saprospiraceae bacterium]
KEHSYFCYNMLLTIFKSKIHRATITEANLNYVGSITIDEDLLDEAKLMEGEKVQIVNNNNGERIETYVIKGERGSGQVCLNGAAARRAEVGDIVIIISYALMTPEEAKDFKPAVVFPDEHNRIVM